MSINPTSFRLPFALPKEVHPAVHDALRLTYQSCVDLNQAIASLKTQVDANAASATAAVTTVQNIVSTGGGGGGGTFPTFGSVNLQPNLTPGAYTLVQTDLAGLILVNSSVPFALTLNSSLTVPFFATVYNFGSGTVTATPSVGTVNNLASMTLTTGQFGIFYFDGTNWWDVFPLITLPLTATSGSLGGGAMLIGATITITVPVTGATTSMVATTSPQTYPGAGFVWDAYVDSPNSVTVRLTCVSAGTPAASLYNVRCIQ